MECENQGDSASHHAASGHLHRCVERGGAAAKQRLGSCRAGNGLHDLSGYVGPQHEAYPWPGVPGHPPGSKLGHSDGRAA